MIRSAWIGAVATVVVLASGCAVLSAGNPVPAGHEMRTDDPPARPRELKLDGKDPCGLVPRSDWAKFYIDKPGTRKQAESYNSPQCFYSNSVGAFGVILVVTEGIEEWRSGNRTAQPGEVADIQGFPAISLRRPTDQLGCFVAVDVAEGQYLMATVIIDVDKLSRLPERCEYAHMLAESAMSTLVEL